mmetsp:Transcript_34441/g.83333  ORF Transcript_34441/g.83333 Transcript_34441/m.83333 type:complete len:239 (-) Transcript_34441:80-796(-)
MNRAMIRATLVCLLVGRRYAIVNGLSIPHHTSRRKLLQRATAAVSAGTFAAIVEDANAACLPGDVSEDCIGVYKLPYLDAKDSSWVNDEETLALFAPDIRYVKTEALPSTVGRAKEQLLAQRGRVKVIRATVFDGDLRGAGVEILTLIPKVNSAGVKIEEFVRSKTKFGDEESEKVFGAFGDSMNELLTQWNELDIEIGQALRGQRGVTTVAQIEILEDLKEVALAFDDFLRIVELNT